MNTAPYRVTVAVPARLHLGFVDLNGGLGRRFGSIGLAIGTLQTRITIARADTTKVSGPDSDRASRYLDQMCDSLGLDAQHRVDIAEAVPCHAGLGSGTQLALAVAAGVRRLHGLPLDVRGDALRLGRGGRSGIGIGLFDHGGGVLVDGGRGAATGPAPIISRIPFPEAWRILLALDPSRTGQHGESETVAFAQLPLFPAADAAHLCRLVIMQALPALAELDLVPFAAAIKEIQARLGAYFAPWHGGAPFTSPAVATALELLEAHGALGGGQSSWGPTGFAFTQSCEEAERLVNLAQSDPRCRGLDIRACKGLNHGATITATATPEP